MCVTTRSAVRENDGGEKMSKPFISICIPSYNRPQTLLRLLRSIDTTADDIQIVICEDKAPKRPEVRAVVEEFKKETHYEVKYIENEVNKGYDWNIRDFITQADGEYNIYMGDDDGFIPGKLDEVITFLRGHREIGYMLRSSQRSNGEYMRYYSDTKFFESGQQSYQELYRKSVFISGFTYKREWAKDTMTDRFDGTLLYQLYILAEICLNHPSAYLNVPFTHNFPERNEYYFGTSEKEKQNYTPGKVSVRGQMIFLMSFLKIAQYIDGKYSIASTEYIKRDLSKYSYPVMWWVRQDGRIPMCKFAWEMWKEGFGCTIYFYLYVIGLFFFGMRFCDWIISTIKGRLGRAPQL